MLKPAEVNVDKEATVELTVLKPVEVVDNEATAEPTALKPVDVTVDSDATVLPDRVERMPRHFSLC